jgi:hypothetical protein
MKKLILLACFIIATAFSQKHDPALKPYVEFLGKNPVSAKEYVLELFKDHDIVIICERGHPELTQYDLFLSIVSDPRFINDVGNVFTEIGLSTQADRVNAFVHAENLPPDTVGRRLIEFQRNCTFHPIWENINYPYFIRGIYALNQKLPVGKKINLFNSDMPFDWATVDTTQLRMFWDGLGTRDSVIASQVITRFDAMERTAGKRHKALVIMNYRHAFGHKFETTKGVRPQNVGRFLFDRYGDRVANAYLNFVALKAVRSDNDIDFVAIQDGKWDASFKAMKITDAGFDFQNSPFGRDTFDIYPRKVEFTYQDVFNGLLYYLSPDRQKYVPGVPGLVDSGFTQEIQRRFRLLSTLPGGRFKPMTDKDLRGFMHDANTRREVQIDMLDSLQTQIGKWLK